MAVRRIGHEAPALTELDQLELELTAARDAVARAYARNRMGIGDEPVELRARYDQLSIQYGHDCLKDELLSIDDETQRNARAIGYSIEETIRLAELTDEYTENNRAYRALRGLDTRLEKGPRAWSTFKRIGMTAVSAAAGKVVGGIFGGALAAGASVAVQDVAKKLRFGSVREDMSTQFDALETSVQASAKNPQGAVARAHQEAMARLEARIAHDRTNSRDIYRSAAIRGGKVGAIVGLGGAALANFIPSAGATELSTHAYTSDVPDISAGTDSVNIPSIGDASGDVKVPGALQSSGLFEVPSLDAQGDTVSVPTADGGTDSIRIDSLSTAGDGSVDVPAIDNPQSIRVAEMASGQDVSATSAQATGDSIRIDSLGSSNSIDVAGANSAAGDIEVPSIHDKGPDIQVPSIGDAGPDIEVPSIDSSADIAVGGVEPGNTAEFTGELPSVDDGEGLNSFTHDNYDMHLTHEESLELGEELHERGFMYRDDAGLGEKYSNPFGINEPGVIDQDTHDTIMDFKDDGEFNDSYNATTDIKQTVTIDSPDAVLPDGVNSPDELMSADSTPDQTIHSPDAVLPDGASSAAELTATGDEVLFTPDNHVQLPVNLDNAQNWISSGQIQNFNVLPQAQLADLAEYLEKQNITFGDSADTEIISRNPFTGDYYVNAMPDDEAVPLHVRNAFSKYFEQSNFALAG